MNCNPLGFSVYGSSVGCHFLLRGIFLIQGSNPHLLHWQAASLPTEPSGKPCWWSYIIAKTLFSSRGYLAMWIKSCLCYMWTLQWEAHPPHPLSLPSHPRLPPPCSVVTGPPPCPLFFHFTLKSLFSSESTKVPSFHLLHHFLGSAFLSEPSGCSSPTEPKARKIKGKHEEKMQPEEAVTFDV